VRWLLAPLRLLRVPVSEIGQHLNPDCEPRESTFRVQIVQGLRLSDADLSLHGGAVVSRGAAGACHPLRRTRTVGPVPGASSMPAACQRQTKPCAGRRAMWDATDLQRLPVMFPTTKTSKSIHKFHPIAGITLLLGLI